MTTAKSEKETKLYNIIFLSVARPEIQRLLLSIKVHGRGGGGEGDGRKAVAAQKTIKAGWKDGSAVKKACRTEVEFPAPTWGERYSQLLVTLLPGKLTLFWPVWALTHTNLHTVTHKQTKKMRKSKGKNSQTDPPEI